jgi:hypothetical protein
MDNLYTDESINNEFIIISKIMNEYIIQKFNNTLILKKMSEETKQIYHFINNIFNEIEESTKCGRNFYDDKSMSKLVIFMRVIRRNDPRDYYKLSVYIKYIINLYENYNFGLLFYYFDMDGKESGEPRSLNYFKKKYEYVRDIMCNYELPEFYELVEKYKNIIFHIQNIIIF